MVAILSLLNKNLPKSKQQGNTQHKLFIHG